MFDQAYAKLMIIEGGYVNRPSDRGGETFCGISRKHHPDWPGWVFIDTWIDDGKSVKQLTLQPLLMGMVKAFYRSEYWQRLSCDLLSDVSRRLVLELFDSGVNCGRRKSARWLQHAVNLFAQQNILVEDGIIGSRTIVKTTVQVENWGDSHLLKAMNGQQYMHYQQLVEKDPSQLVNFRGWMKRVWED